MRNVVVTLDGEPVKDWREVLESVLGPGKRSYSESTMSNHILSANEEIDIFVPQDASGAPLKSGPADSDGGRFDAPAVPGPARAT